MRRGERIARPIAARVRAGAVAALCALALCASGARADEWLRVRVLQGASQVRVVGAGLVVDGARWSSDSLTASARGGRLVVGSRARTKPVALRAKGALRVNGRALPGSVRLVPTASGIDVVNLVPLEPYVASAVASETPASWPREALRAQAVVARSYALHERTRRAAERFDLEANVLSQRYAAGEVPASARDAAQATRGQVLVFDGAPILAAFHSSSGGATASAAEVWGREIPYLRSVSSPDDAAPDYFWSYEIPLSDLADALREAGLAPGRIDRVAIAERSASGRVLAVSLGALELSGRNLREILGGRALRSSLFDARLEGERVRFLGSGSGHGVGMCQWGASELARRGRTYRQILAHYYPGTSLRSYRATRSVATNWSGSR